MPTRAAAAHLTASLQETDRQLSQLPYGSLYRSLPGDLQGLMRVAVGLYTRERREGMQFADYSFVVFPMAKAYEGFLKQYLLRFRLLSSETYHDRKFRIGRALNPDLRNQLRDDQWLYDDVVALCSEKIGRQLWETWLKCRNQVFHYFPAASATLTLQQAGAYVLLLAQTMDQAQRCQDEAG